MDRDRVDSVYILDVGEWILGTPFVLEYGIAIMMKFFDGSARWRVLIGGFPRV